MTKNGCSTSIVALGLALCLCLGPLAPDSRAASQPPAKLLGVGPFKLGMTYAAFKKFKLVN